MEAWADLKGTYRFFSNPRVKPEDIGAPHRALVRSLCASHKVVLVVHDGSDLQAAKVPGDLYVQQSCLAVTVEGQILGLLEQRWYQRVKQPKGETQAQRQERWRESDVWPEAVEAIGASPDGCRWIHVADSASDDARFFRSCSRQGAGFVSRARHDRRLKDKATTLWPHMASLPAAGTMEVKIGAQQGGRGQPPRRGRTAQLEVRFGEVSLACPSHDSQADSGPLSVRVVYLKEIDVPADITEPVDWMLITSEPAETLKDALLIADYYTRRWVIEEWHRCLKEGCGLEKSQLDKPEDLQRLAAVLSVIAVRLMQLREMAQEEMSQDEPARAAARLKKEVPALWILVVASLYGDDPATLTPKKFWQNIARRGGFIGRKSDGLPGWKVIWRGWHDITQMVLGAELAQRKSCG
jgi:Transposase DDE domain/Transposase Tn5 dimerisation domain